MPVAEDLLGVRFDSQMLAKLALSVAGVLLVSWAYRFYTSRRSHIRQDGRGSHQSSRTAPDTGTFSEGSTDSCEEELLQADKHSPRQVLSARHRHLPKETLNIPSAREIPLEQHMHSHGELQNIPSVGETFSNQHEDSTGEPHNIPSPGEIFSVQHEDLPREPQNIPSLKELHPDQHEDSLGEPHNTPSPGETFSDQHEDSPGEPHNIPSPVEIFSDQHMDLLQEPQNISSSGEMFSDQHEDLPREPQNISSFGEMFSDKYKPSSEEAQRCFLSHVEPDEAIVRGDENLNHNSDPSTEESMVQHDPPGIKQTPVAPDRSAQGALHINYEDTENASQSPPPVEALYQVGVSPTVRLEPNVSMCRELKQDLGHLGDSCDFLSKKETGIGNLLEMDRNAPVDAVGTIYDNHLESSLQSVSGENVLASPSLPNPSSECYEAALSHDPRQLKEPEESGTETVQPLSASITPPLSPQDLILPSAQEHNSTTSPDPLSPRLQGLVRKDSYMHIVENPELQIPILNPQAPTPLSTLSSQTTSSKDLRSKSPSSLKDPTILSNDTSGGRRVEAVEKLGTSQIPTEESISELARLLGRLDLGNCLEALSLARKEGHACLHYAALKVMSDNFLQVLQDPGLYGNLRGGDRDLIRKLRMRGKQCLVVADLDLQDCAESESSKPKTSSSLYYYEDHKDSWNLLCPIPQEVVSRGSAMCVMDNYLFVTLGCQGTGRDVQPSRKAFCYNPATSIWKEISPMNEARPQCKLVALGGCVYAIGGECLSSVERYDPRTGRWTFVAPMPNDTFAVAHRATTCNGELFVSGGTLKYTLLRYNPATNIWRRSPIVRSKERTVEMVSVRNFLYRFDVGSTCDISVYRYHVVARLWYECCSRKLPHCSAFQCSAMDDVIYCVSRKATMKFLADEVSPSFMDKDLSILPEAKGTLLPFIMALPETETLQTRV